MATEKQLGPGTNRQGEEHIELLSSGTPHVVSFNEKTGKATRESHLNAPIDAPAPDKALSPPDAKGDSAAAHAHNEFAPLSIPDISERVTVGIDANGESRVFAAPAEPSANLRLQPAAGSQSTDNRIMIEPALAPAARVQAPGAEVRSHRELVADTSASASIVQVHKVEQMASTVFAPVPEKAERNSLEETAAAQQQHASGERPRVDALTIGALAATETLVSPGTQDTTTFSISAAAVERLHAEEKMTSELNRQLDQLAARLKEPRH